MSHKTRRIYPKGPHPSVTATVKWDEMTRPYLLFPAPSSSVNHTFEPLAQVNARCCPRIIGRYERLRPGVSAVTHSCEESNANILAYHLASGVSHRVTHTGFLCIIYSCKVKDCFEGRPRPQLSAVNKTMCND